MPKIILLLLLTIFFGSNLFAYQTSVTALARSYPFSGNLEAQIKQDNLLWDQRQDGKFMFGYWQPRILLAAAGTAEAGINLYPISVLELSASSGMTSRYYKVKKFDCDLQICNGVVSREKIGARIILGKEFEFGTVLAVPSYQTVKSRHSDDAKPLADEQEQIITKNGGDQAEITSVMLGLKQDDEVIGLVHRYAHMKDAKTSSESQYLIYRFKMNEIGYTVGLGQYKSDLNDKGFSAIFALQWLNGESIGLF